MPELRLRRRVSGRRHLVTSASRRAADAAPPSGADAGAGHASSSSDEVAIGHGGNRSSRDWRRRNHVELAERRGPDTGTAHAAVRELRHGRSSRPGAARAVAPRLAAIGALILAGAALSHLSAAAFLFDRASAGGKS